LPFNTKTALISWELITKLGCREKSAISHVLSEGFYMKNGGHKDILKCRRVDISATKWMTKLMTKYNPKTLT